jgi:hypothetical protein
MVAEEPDGPGGERAGGGLLGIPAPGERIPAGKPVLTFFARGDSAAACEERLREIAADLDRRLHGG